MLPFFHAGFQVFFYKRAQILVGDIWAAYGKSSPPHPYGFHDIDQLTMFADYRVSASVKKKSIDIYVCSFI